MCLKAASGWAFDYIIKFVNYGNSGNCSMESVAYYACKSIIQLLLLLYSDEKCIDILKCKQLQIG